MRISCNLILIPACLGVNADVSSESGTRAALTAMVQQLMPYYTSNNYKGLVTENPSKGPDGFQWYEGGIYWGIMMEYAKVTGDKQYDPVMLKGLGVASHGKQGSFLESESAPAWNDDILWWAMPSATGALIYGPDATFTDGLSMKQVTINTFNQVWKTWDDKCGGGLYWIRNQRKGAGYKSTISNVQQMLIGAQLTAITGDKSYVQKSDQILKWLKAQNLLASNGSVYDGIDGDDNCKIVKKRVTYNAGVILGALGWMYKVTNDKSYIDQADIILNPTIRGAAGNGILTDPCENNDSCPLNTVSYKGALARGLGFLYEHTPQVDQKQKIKSVLASSVKAMLKICDGEWNCGNNWSSGRMKGKSVHDQMNSLELITAYYKTFEKGSNPINTTISIDRITSSTSTMISSSMITDHSTTQTPVITMASSSYPGEPTRAIGTPVLGTAIQDVYSSEINSKLQSMTTICSIITVMILAL